jgi:hypothetical protein
VAKATVYELTPAGWHRKSFVQESNHLEVLLVQLASRMQLELETTENNPPIPFLGLLHVAVELTSTDSSVQAVTRDMEAARIHQAITNSLVGFLSSSSTSRKEDTTETSNGSSQK